MEHKIVKGVNHLFRLAPPNKLVTIHATYSHGYSMICKAIIIKDTPYIKKEMLFILNQYYDCGRYSVEDLREHDENVREFLSGLDNSKFYLYSHVASGVNHVYSSLHGSLSDIELLDDKFEDEFEHFKTENSSIVRKLCGDYCLSENQVKCCFLYSNGSRNFFKWMVEVGIKHAIPFRSLRNLVSWSAKYPQLVKKLSKQSITAYKTNKDIADLIVEVTSLRNQKKSNDVINSFNTLQKKLLKSITLGRNDMKALSAFSRLSFKKKANFINKVASIEDTDELMRQLYFVTSMHYKWNKKSLIDYLENVDGLKYEMILNKDDVVLIEVLDFETIKKIAKTTSWCISKNLSYWRNYVGKYDGDASQYVLFDFSKKEDAKDSIFGFTTVKYKGITNAHNFVNADVMPQQDAINSVVKCLLANNGANNDIYQILASHGIDLSLIVKTKDSEYEWSKDGLLKYIYSKIDKGHVKIIKDADNKLALEVVDDNVQYLFTNGYGENFGEEDEYVWSCKHIIFADFSLPIECPNHIEIAIISERDRQEYCSEIYNILYNIINVNFDNKLFEWGIPYDVIRRKFSAKAIMTNALMSYNMPMVEKCLSKDKYSLKNALKRGLGNRILNIIVTSVTELYTLDIFNLFYNDSNKLSDFVSIETVGRLLYNMVRQFSFSCGRDDVRNHFDGFRLPNDEEISKMINGEIENSYIFTYIITYYTIMRILEAESESDQCKLLNDTIRTLGSRSNGLKENFEVLLTKTCISRVAALQDISNTMASNLYFAAEKHKETLALLDEAAKHNNTLARVLGKSNDDETITTIGEELYADRIIAEPHF